MTPYELEVLVDLQAAKLRSLYRLLASREWTGGICNLRCVYCGGEKPNHRQDCSMAGLVPEAFRREAMA